MGSAVLLISSAVAEQKILNWTEERVNVCFQGKTWIWTDKKPDEACSQGRLRATEPHEALPSALHRPGRAGDEELVREESVFGRHQIFPGSLYSPGVPTASSRQNRVLVQNPAQELNPDGNSTAELNPDRN